MIGPKSLFTPGAQSINNLNFFLEISTGTPRDKLSVAFPAMEAIHAHFQLLQGLRVGLDQVNFKEAGEYCYKLTMIQERIASNDPADAENIRELSIQITKVKEYITTFCFRALNNDLDSGLQQMRDKCQASSNALYVLVKNYVSKKRSVIGFRKLVANLKRPLKDFRDSALAYSATARKITKVVALDRLDIQYANASVMKKFDAILTETIMEYKKINDSITELKEQVAPFAYQVEVKTLVAAPVAFLDIIDKSNSHEAMTDHAKMLAGFSFDLDLILKDGRIPPLSFLSRCSAIFEHLEAADERMEKLYEIRDEKKREFIERTASNALDENATRAMKAYTWFSTRAQECEAVLKSESFDNAKMMLRRAMNTEAYPHFDAEGRFEKPLTFNSNFWLVRTLNLHDFTDFQCYQDSLLELKRDIDRIYTSIVGNSGKMTARQPFLYLQKQIKEWSRCSLL